MEKISQKVIIIGAVIFQLGCSGKWKILEDESGKPRVNVSKEYQEATQLKKWQDPNEKKIIIPNPIKALLPKKNKQAKVKKKTEKNTIAPVVVKKIESKLETEKIEKAIMNNTPKKNQSPFKVGESIRFAVTYFNLAAGYLDLDILPYAEIKGKKAYHIRGLAKSSRIFSAFYKVKDQFDLYIDTETYLPISYTVKINESKQKSDIRSVYNFETLKATYWEDSQRKGKARKTKKKDWSLKPLSQNMYSAFYYLRTLDLTPGKEYKFPIANKGKNYDFKLKVVKKERLKTDIGEFDTIMLEPIAKSEGRIEKSGDVFLWVTDDEQRTPVKFEAHIKIGKIVGELRKFKQ